MRPVCSNQRGRVPENVRLGDGTINVCKTAAAGSGKGGMVKTWDINHSVPRNDFQSLTRDDYFRVVVP